MGYVPFYIYMLSYSYFEHKFLSFENSFFKKLINKNKV